MQRALVDPARRGDEEAFADLARAVGIGDGDRVQDPARRRSSRGRRRADLSRPGASCLRCATPTGSMPGLADPCPCVLCRGAAATQLGRQVHILPVDGRTGATTWRPSFSVTARAWLPAPVAGTERDLRPASLRGTDPPGVADELGVPLGTVKSRLHYATQALRAALDADARTVPSTERLA